MKFAILLTIFTPVFTFNAELSGFDVGHFFIQADRLKLKLGFIEEKLGSLGTHQPFLTQSGLRKITQDFLVKVTKKRKHGYQHKPDKYFNKLEKEKMAVYKIMRHLFDKTW